MFGVSTCLDEGRWISGSVGLAGCLWACVCMCVCPPGVLESVWVWSAASAGSFICSPCWALRMCGHRWCRGKGDGRGPRPTLPSSGRDRQHEEARVFSHCEEAILVGLHCKDLGAGHFYGRWPWEAKSGGGETEIGKEEKPSMCVLMKSYCGGPQKLSPLGTLWGPMMSHWEGAAGGYLLLANFSPLGVWPGTAGQTLGQSSRETRPLQLQVVSGLLRSHCPAGRCLNFRYFSKWRGATEALKQRSEMTPL